MSQQILYKKSKIVNCYQLYTEVGKLKAVIYHVTYSMKMTRNSYISLYVSPYTNNMK